MGKRTLSIFVDESGILNESAESSRFYVLTLLLHDQDYDVTGLARDLDRSFAEINVVRCCFHAGPIIRGNDEFAVMDWEWRNKIFARMMGFARRVDFRFHCLYVDKKFVDAPEQIVSRLERQLAEFIDSNKERFDRFDSIKVYYDCGQTSITNFLHRFFAIRPTLPVEYAQAVKPRKYKLFQLADLVCSLKLIELKIAAGLPMAKSEYAFFGGPRRFLRTFLSPIKTKEI